MTRFIQVGVGGFGGGWVRWLSEARGVRVVALVDLSDKALAAARQVSGCDESVCFKTLKEAAAAVEADAVLCATPPEYHRQVAVEAMRLGFDVISEKPMADTLGNCKAMVRASEQTGRHCVISQNYRYRPPIWAMADMIRRGSLGEIGQVKINFFKGVNFGGGFRHVMDYPLLVDMSIHHFDLIRFITGLDAVAVSGTAWNPPWSNYAGDCSNSIVFEMNNGARVIYSGSWCAKGDHSDWNGNWQIEGTKGMLAYDHEDVTLHEAPELYQVKRTRKISPKPMTRQGQQYVLADFMKARDSGVRPKTDVYDNIRSVAMVFAAVKAVKTGRKVPVLDKTIVDMIRGR